MADLDTLEGTWDNLGKHNAFWAVLSDKKNWDRNEFFERGRNEINEVLGILDSHNAAPKFGKAMDFGCGVGRLSQALGEHFSQVVGVDIANSMVKQATQLNNMENVSFQHVASGDLKVLKDKSFDFVLADIVFQHMENKFALNYMKEMHRVLKEGGVLVFQLPSKSANTWKGLLIKGLPDSVLTMLRKGMEMHSIKRTKVLHHLRDTGFDVITVEHDSNHKHWQAYFYYARKAA